MQIDIKTRYKTLSADENGNTDREWESAIEILVGEKTYVFSEPSDHHWKLAVQIASAIIQLEAIGLLRHSHLELDEFACTLLRKYLEELKESLDSNNLERGLKILAAIVYNYMHGFKRIDLLNLACSGGEENELVNLVDRESDSS